MKWEERVMQEKTKVEKSERVREGGREGGMNDERGRREGGNVELQARPAKFS